MGSKVTHNKSLKVVRIRSLDSLNRRMLRILCAVCVCPLALRYTSNEIYVVSVVPFVVWVCPRFLSIAEL